MFINFVGFKQNQASNYIIYYQILRPNHHILSNLFFFFQILAQRNFGIFSNALKVKTLTKSISRKPCHLLKTLLINTKKIYKKAYLVTNLAKSKPFQTFDSLNDPISKEEIQKTMKWWKTIKPLERIVFQIKW